MKRILLTGGTGYLGSRILRKLADDGNCVILLKRSFSNTERIKEYIKKISVYDIDRVPLETVFNENAIDIIIHCATDYGRTENNPLAVVDANLIFPLKLLEQSKKNHIKCFINTDTVLDKRIDNYSLSKKQFKEWLYTYRKIFSCVNVALEHFYGPGDNPNKFVTYILHNLIKNVDMIDLTKGEQKRDFIYIDDVVDAFAKIIKSSDDFFENFYEFEIGSSQSLSIREFVELAKKISGNTGTVLNFGAIPYRENEIMSHQADTTGISGLGWKCTISPAEGLRKMFESEKRLINQDLS
ncbi:MAG: NAD(P)-dependent oxidoreductase [Methanoregula sp.]|jgi:nucleoside-diphosphate-sugar epimerase